MVETRFAEAGILGRRNSTAEEGFGSALSGDAIVTGELCSLWVKDGVRTTFLGTASSPTVVKDGKLASPGNAIAPCGLYEGFEPELLVLDGVSDIWTEAKGVFPTLSTCAAVRFFLFGI